MRFVLHLMQIFVVFGRMRSTLCVSSLNRVVFFYHDSCFFRALSHTARAISVCVRFAEDIKKFVDDYPQFRALQTNACKHMALAVEINRKIDARRLLEVCVCVCARANFLRRIAEL